jgi:hypothetical protein
MNIMIAKVGRIPRCVELHMGQLNAKSIMDAPTNEREEEGQEGMIGRDKLDLHNSLYSSEHTLRSI